MKRKWSTLLETARAELPEPMPVRMMAV